MSFKFQIIKTTNRARLGKISTSHGAILTPAFIPLATRAAVKTLDNDDIRAVGFNALMANTYHLLLQPGDKLIKKLGGLHKFMNWNSPLFTDSGGYQIFSLGKGRKYGVEKMTRKQESEVRCISGQESLIKITDDGVWFSSPVDGRKIFIRPEDSIKIQENLGADIIFTFDECVSPTNDYAYIKEAMKRTHLWAKRCLGAKKRKDLALFGIIQGGNEKKLRKESAKFISSLEFDGMAIGGSFGREEMRKVLDWTVPLLPEELPRHLLGVGEITDILAAVYRGIDTFDCVEPTRLGRHGTLFTADGKMRILKSEYRWDKNSVEKNCPCQLCQNYSRAYLHHLFRAKEISALRLATIHNLTFVSKFMENIRMSIKTGQFNEFKRKFLKKFKGGAAP